MNFFMQRPPFGFFEAYAAMIRFEANSKSIGGSRLFTLFADCPAFADDAARAQVGVGRHLEEHGLQLRVVDFTVFAEGRLFHVGVDNFADEVVEGLRLVIVDDLALHDERAVVYDRRPRLALAPREDAGLVGSGGAHRSDVVGAREHSLVDDVDGELFLGDYVFVREVRLVHAYQNAVVAYDAEVSDHEPVDLAVAQATDDRRGRRVEREHRA